ncbi:Uncharacterised protein [Serratia proteamaculans]|jgi:hypothetical protein|uniref:DUF2157 domain-containing protein n=2 Tax=Serratia proteamaculans TaxID=28151 RepID=A0ABS0TV65_SERPR|nr:hypothetical protein F8R23_19940 [Serratia proteamaculans]SPZ55061.1 Uncharacterised protein [Serratia quinivorans]MBI6181145.1 hypothetical protein [Serratia proteamaculans]NWA74513.1 hypothetical protein [Serratia proteamaculans]RYM47728.1 hypothetical protein BSQ96_23560 [Serratia proteamaculans]
MSDWMINRLISQGREMEHQILQRDPAVYAGVDAQLDQHFLTPGQRLSPPGVGNVMLLLICLTLGLAGTMGLLADLAFAATGRASAATLLGSGAVMAVWMTLILFQLAQGKNVGVLLLKYYLGMLAVFLIGAVAAWIANITGMANGLMLLCACIGGVIFSNRTVFYLYVAYFRTRRRVFVKRRWQMEAMRNP